MRVAAIFIICHRLPLGTNLWPYHVHRTYNTARSPIAPGAPRKQTVSDKTHGLVSMQAEHRGRQLNLFHSFFILHVMRTASRDHNVGENIRAENKRRVVFRVCDKTHGGLFELL